MKPRIAINGFGRIGRMLFRCNLERDLVDIVAINQPSPPEELALFLKYDSVYGKLPNEISHDDKNLIVDGNQIPLFNNRNPEDLPWKELEIDVVAECTGVFRDREGAGKHLIAGAKRVVISAPGKDPDVSFVCGVNNDSFDPEAHKIISNVSCTTNSLAPIVMVLQNEFGIENGLMTTIHSYTNDQRLVDASHDDLRRARAAALSAIPTSTGAAKAIGDVIPELKGKLNGISVRIPTPTVSLTDFVVNLKKEVSAEEINATLQKHADGALKGIMDVSHEPLVSIDYRANPHSSIVDALSTITVGSMAKILAWYDNEWGYSMRMVEILKQVGAA